MAACCFVWITVDKSPVFRQLVGKIEFLPLLPRFIAEMEILPRLSGSLKGRKRNEN